MNSMEQIHVNLEAHRDKFYPVSTMSPEVSEFFSFYAPREGKSSAAFRFIDPETGLFDWLEVNRHLDLHKLAADELGESLSDKDFCASRIGLLGDVLHEVHEFFEDTGEDVLEGILLENTSWTNRSEDLIKAFSNKLGEDTKFGFDTLLFTSVLEFAVGNVFFSLTGKNPPHLLKDLLRSPEINEFFSEMMPLTRYLLGSPTSVNLRNIFWHGFPRVYEIDEAYPNLVLLLLVNMGKKLSDSSLVLISRPPSLDSLAKMELIHVTSDWMESKLVTFLKVICSSRTLLDYHKMFWVRAIHCYLDGSQYGEALLLILPQLEMMLRLLYGAANDLEVSAKVDQYYIILDTILEKETALQRPNELLSIMDDSTLSLMYDLFVSPRGPRIRDRLSHGELPLSLVSQDVARTVFLFVFHVISQFDSIIELPTLISGYQSVFHPVSELFGKTEDLQRVLDDLYDMKLPEELAPGVLLGADGEKRFPPTVWKYKEVVLSVENSATYLRGLAFDREIANLLIQVLENALEGARNFREAMRTRSEELQSHTLSSARRKTFESMVKHFDEICLGLLVLLCICKRATFEKLFMKELSADERSLCLRDFKKALKWAENLQKYLNVKNNEWESACETTKLLLELFDGQK